MANAVSVLELLVKGFAGEAAQVESKAVEQNLSPAALLERGYAEADQKEKKAKAALSIEITKTPSDDK